MRVIDYNFNVKVHLRLKEDSPGNDFKKEKLLRNVMLMRKELHKGLHKKDQNKNDKLTTKFIWNHRICIDKEITRITLTSEDKVITQALYQILDHSNAFPLGSHQLSKRHYFKVMLPLLNKIRQKVKMIQLDPDMDGRTAIIFNLPHSTQLRDLWILLKKDGMIKYIILPKHRDRNNFRYDFIQTFDEATTRIIIRKFSGMSFQETSLKLDWAHKRSTEYETF